MLENQTIHQPPFAQSNGDKVAAILRAVCHAVAKADQEAGNVETPSHWYALINAAANHAHYLLTGDSVEGLHEGGKGGA